MACPLALAYALTEDRRVQPPEDAISARSKLILLYALCGFANFGSVGVLVGGVCAMAPERKDDIVALGFKAMLSGTIASLMGGALN